MSVVSIVASIVITWAVAPMGLTMNAIVPALLVPSVVAPAASYWGASLILRIHVLNQKLEHLVRHDHLTGLLNRGAFFDCFSRAGVPQTGSLIMIDIDHFKSINDTYGHQMGDLVIQKTAEILTGKSEPEGIVARLGGEEFVVFCADMKPEDANALAEEMRRAAETLSISFKGQILNYTISIGVAVLDGKTKIDDALHSTDEALYEAKRQGRNIVVVH